VLFWNTPLHPIVLLTATGVDRVEQALRDSIALIEQQLPGRVRGYHFANSFASRMRDRLLRAMIIFQMNEAWSAAPGLA